MKKAKTKRRTALDRASARLRTALRRETINIVEIGKILIEIRDEHLEHGEWQSWLAENFDLPYRTAIRYVNAAEYVARKGKSATVALSNLSPSVLYRLAEGQLDEQEEAAILAEARKRRVDEDAMWAICESLAPPADDAADAGRARGHGGGGDDDAESAPDPEIEAVLDGPPPAVPPPAPNPPPTDFALRDFDAAISTLKRLMTKSATQFARTIHSADVLESVESFIHAVSDRGRGRGASD
jgi:hypothetical protein